MQQTTLIECCACRPATCPTNRPRTCCYPVVRRTRRKLGRRVVWTIGVVQAWFDVRAANLAYNPRPSALGDDAPGRLTANEAPVAGYARGCGNGERDDRAVRALDRPGSTLPPAETTPRVHATREALKISLLRAVPPWRVVLYASEQTPARASPRLRASFSLIGEARCP